MKIFLVGFLTAVLIMGCTATVFATYGDRTITVNYDNIKVLIDQKRVLLKDANGNEVEPFIYNGTTYLPVRAISNALGQEVSWDDSSKLVYIGTQPNVVREGKSKLPTKIANSEVGKSYTTKWFEFTVESVTSVSEYAGYKAKTGNKLIDVVISETGVIESTMGTFDFYLDAPKLDDYVYPMKPLDKTMMPESFILKTGDQAKYHMVYEIPASMTDILLCYTEINEEGTAKDEFILKTTL